VRGTVFGPVGAVAAGGASTLLVALLVAWPWPEMRQLTTLRGPAKQTRAAGA
jgi:hypothetical protein